MTVMNDNEKRTGPVEDHRSKPRWTAARRQLQGSRTTTLW